MATKAYEVVHGFGHEGVYYTRENQHEIASRVSADVIDTLVRQKMLREVPVVDASRPLDEQHAQLRKLPEAKEYASALESTLEERGLSGLAEATEEVARTSVDVLPGTTPASGSGAVEAARSPRKTARKGGR